MVESITKRLLQQKRGAVFWPTLYATRVLLKIWARQICYIHLCAFRPQLPAARFLFLGNLCTTSSYTRSSHTLLSICFLTVAECPSYTAIQRYRSRIPCYRCPYLEVEQSVPAYHVCALYVCLPRILQGSFPLQAFFAMTFTTATFVVPAVVTFGHLNRSSYLLTCLLTLIQYRFNFCVSDNVSERPGPKTETHRGRQWH